MRVSLHRRAGGRRFQQVSVRRLSAFSSQRRVVRMRAPRKGKVLKLRAVARGPDGRVVTRVRTVRR